MRRFCAAIIAGFLLVLPGVALSWDAGSWSGVRRLTGTTTLSMPGLGTTSTDGLVLENTTAAAAGAQQISSRVRWSGRGWETDTGSSQQTDYIAQLVPVQGAAAPQARLDFNYQINGGGYQATPTISLLNGNVGIETTGPVAKLHVAGGDIVIDNAQSYRSRNTADNGSIDLIGTDGASNGILIGGTLAGGSIGFDDGNGKKMRFMDGKLRIGDANTPSNNLEVIGTGYISGNVGIAQTTFGNNAAKVLSFGGPATPPTTRPPDAFTLYPFDVNGAGTMGLAWMSEDNGIGILGLKNGFGTITPSARITSVQAGAETFLGLSGAAGNHTSIAIGRTAAEARLAIVAVDGEFAGGSLSGDAVLRVDSATNKLHLLAGAGNAMWTVTSTDVKYGKALVALGGGAAPTLGTIGGSGPTAAAQNAWIQMQDSTGANVWIAVWK